MLRLLLSVFILATIASCSEEETISAKNKHFKGQIIEGTSLLKFNIPQENFDIEFVQMSTDTAKFKPAIIFLQGSLPIPLVIDVDGYKHIHCPFDYKVLSEKFHVFEISMPNTPVQASIRALNKQYHYVPDTSQPHQFDSTYLKYNVLETYTERAAKVVETISSFPWVDKTTINLIGHSQGAKVACVTASKNSNISHVALLGFNAFGRYDQLIRQLRFDFKKGKLDSATYIQELDSTYNRYQYIFSNPADYLNENSSWVSFSRDYTEDLLQINAPIFIGYGTEDIIAENCDLIPLKFIESRKDNYTLKPYLGLDHGFYEIKNGQPDRRNGAHFNDVIQDIITWINH